MTQSKAWSVDARVPVVFGRLEQAGPEDAVLVEDDAPPVATAAVVRVVGAVPAPDHAVGCACCRPRAPVASVLGSLFLARARGEVPFFRRVLAVVADEAGMRAAIDADSLVSGRFRVVKQDTV